jgi:glucose/mannose-6-phosphate isomerase
VSQLDDAAHRGAVDPDDALADVEASAAQWRAAGEHAPAGVDLAGVGAIVVAGMGGSGIAGDVVAAVAAGRLAVPVVVHKRYGLPDWVGPRVLVCAVSHSGDTEETLSAVEEAHRRGARLCAVTSGGALGRLAHERALPVAIVPGGGQPRHALGWLAVPLLVALGLGDDLPEAVAVLEALVAEQGRSVPAAANPAKQLGARLASGALPVVYGTAGLAAVAALRLKCQLNENAKRPALAATVPELCHNDVVGWESGPPPERALVWLRDAAGEHPRDDRRAELLDELLAPQAAWRARLDARGSAPLARLASLLVQADLASVYAAHARGVDPTPVASIARLKAALGRVSP